MSENDEDLNTCPPKLLDPRQLESTPTLGDFEPREEPVAASFLLAFEEALANGVDPPRLPDHEGFTATAGAVERRANCIRLLREGMAAAAPDVAAFSLPAHFGRFKIQRELGRGGFGIVYLAEDPDLKRLIALKVPRPESLMDPEARQRFLREAQATAALDHPHLVSVHEVGQEGPICYIASMYCAGTDLAAWLKQNPPLAPRQAAALIAKIADAVEHAHGRGILHRDIKPSNILLTPINAKGQDDEVAFHPKLTDFGLAKSLDGKGALTATGALLGTPQYMPPEQADGRSVGAPGDVYSLGAVLYEALAGQAPFRGTTVLETLDQVRKQEPVPLTSLRQQMPADLNTICLKCLSKEPFKRYHTAAALAEDLRRFCDGRPVLARPVGGLERAWRWCRRNPVVAGLLALVAFVLISGVISTTAMWWQAQANFAQEQIQHERADQNFLKANQQRERAEKNLAQANANFRETAAAIDKYFTKISDDKLLREPRMHELRVELLAEARTFYERLAAQRRNDPSLRREFAHAIFRLGLIESLAGPTGKAQPLLEEALQIYTDLSRDRPDDVAHRYERAQCQYELGFLLLKQGRGPAAEKYLTVAAQEFAELAPARALYLWHEADCYLLIAEAAKDAGERERALQITRKALSKCQQLVSGDESNLYYQHFLARAHFRLGQLLMGTSKGQPALAEFDTARRIIQPIAERICREQLAARELLAATLGSLGTIYAAQGRIAEAEKAMLDGQALWEQLTSENHAMIGYQRDRAASEHNLAGFYYGAQKQDEADRWCQRALALREQLHKTQPDVALYLHDLGMSYRQMAVHANKRKQPAEVIAWNGKAADRFEQALKINPQSAETKSMLAMAAAGRASRLAQLGRHAESLPDWDRSIEHAATDKQFLYRSYRALSRAKAGDWKGAAVDIAANYGQSYFMEIDFRLACAGALSAAAAGRDEALPQSQRQEQAERLATEAVQLLTKLHQAGAFKHPEFRNGLVSDPDLDALRERADFQALLPK